MKFLFLSFDDLTQPLGIASLSAVLHQAGHRAEVASLRDLGRQEALLREFKPDGLCLSLITGQHPLFLERARQLKAAHPHLLVLAGGPHPTFYPECIHEPCLDALCRGEGDRALPALAEAVAARGALPENLENWWIKRPDGSISRSDVGPLIEDLDGLPWPDHALFDRAYPKNRPVVLFAMTARGCPFHCTYCFNHAHRELYRGRGTHVRRRSVAHVVSELQALRRRYPLQMVVFQDDTFNLDKNWLREFAARYPRDVGLPFHCHLRADLLDGETAGLLREAGCFSVKLGLEAGRDDIRNDVLKRGMSLAQFEHACGLLHRHRIRFATENILGVPGTSLDDDLVTYEVNRRVRPHHTFASLLQLYPRTEIAAYALQKGFAAAPVTAFPATFYEDSALALTDKEKRGRLRALFALGVSCKLPVAALRLLTAWPLRTFYEFVDRLWKGYCLRFRLYPYKQGPGSFLRDVRAYLAGKHY